MCRNASECNSDIDEIGDRLCKLRCRLDTLLVGSGQQCDRSAVDRVDSTLPSGTEVVEERVQSARDAPVRVDDYRDDG